MIQHPYNVRIIEPPYYKAYLGYISAQKALRCLSAAYLKWQTCYSNCYLHTNRVDVFKPFGRMDKGSVIPPRPHTPTHPPMLTVCVRAYLQEIAGSWRMIGGMQELESLQVSTDVAAIWTMLSYGA